MGLIELKMPKLGESVSEGTIGKWLKRPGESVGKNDLLVEVQTDKVNTEIPSDIAGKLVEVKVEEGATVPVGTVLAVLETEGATEAVAAPAPAAPAPAPAAPAASVSRPAPAAPPPPPPPAPRADLSEVRAAPAVRKLAQEKGVDIASIRGSGLGGRVTFDDVEAAAAAGTKTAGAATAAQPEVVAAQSSAPARVVAPAPQGLVGDELAPLSQMRKAIAQNMVYAWSAPHAHAVMEIDMTAVQKYRAKVGAEFTRREGFDLSPAAFVMKAAVEALRTVPTANASWSDEGIRIHHAINIGYAVSLGEDGLVVPVIRGADGLSLAGLMRAIRDVVDRAKARKLTFEDFAGGTFTVNNTGPLGTVISSPIVPPGQSAIVSAEAIVKRVVVTDDDQIAIRQKMNLVIGFDHRVVDGSTAARVLGTMRDWLQAVNDSVPVY